MSEENHRIQGTEARRRYDLVLCKLGLPESNDGSFRDDTLRALEALVDVILRIARNDVTEVERDPTDLASDADAIEKAARALYDAFEGGRVRAVNAIASRNRVTKFEGAKPWEELPADVANEWRERAREFLRTLR